MLKVFLGKYELIPFTDCWIWTGALSNGYGSVKIGGRNGKTVSAHRLSYEENVGPIGDKHVLHKCDVKCCVNPAHLFLGTNQDNIKDRVQKGRSCKSPKRPSGLKYNCTPEGTARRLAGIQSYWRARRA